MRRAGLKSMPAGTNYFYFFVSRMDPGFHDSYEVLPLQFIIQTQNPRRRLTLTGWGFVITTLATLRATGGRSTGTAASSLNET
jgi:hypothetical protein